MTQLNLRKTNPGTLCADCVHNTRSATWCKDRFSMRQQGGPVPAVLACTGHTTARQAQERQAGAIGGATLLLIAMLAGSYYVPAAHGQQGYPGPETATATMPPMTWPACTPHCPTNTPVVDARPAATQASEQGGAITPVTSSVYWERVTLPMMAKRYGQ